MTIPAAPDEFRIEHHARDDGATVLSVYGDVDLSTAPTLEQALEGLAAERRPTVLDLSSVGFMDSSGLNVLLQATRSSRSQGWSFAVRSQASDAVVRLFELTAMNGYLPFDDRG